MAIHWRVSAVVLITACISGCLRRTPPPSVITRSTLTFAATVREVHASRVPDQVKPGPDTFVVRVDQIYSGTEILQEYLGREVTVVLTPDSPVRGSAVGIGKQFIFFAAPLVFARSLAVRGEAYRKNAKTTQLAGERTDYLIQDRIRRAETI